MQYSRHGEIIRINIIQKVGDGMELVIEVIAYAIIWALCGGLKRYK